MRISLLSILCCFFIFNNLKGQVKPSADTSRTIPDFNAIIRQNAIPRPIRPGVKNEGPNGVVLPISAFKNRQAFSTFLHQQSFAASTGKPFPFTKSQESTTLNSPICKDSSFEKLIGLTNSIIYMLSLIHTRDDGVEMTGVIVDSTIANGFNIQNGFLLKTDNAGNVLWVKIFADPADNQSRGIYPISLSELQNGDVIVAGSMDTTVAGYNTSSVLIKYDGMGNMLWYKTYISNLAHAVNVLPIDIRSITEGLNGDLIVCGTTTDQTNNNKYHTTIRMDNMGNPIWDVNYGTTWAYAYGCEGLGAYLVNGQIVSVGVAHGDGIYNTPAAVDFLTLDYATGATIKKRFYIPNYSDPVELFRKQFTYYYNRCAQLQNGHYIIYGGLFADFNHTVTPYDHFGVIDFDANQNLSQAYTISSFINSNYYSDQIYFDNKGNSLFSLSVFDNSGYSSNHYLGTLFNHQFTNERVAYYNNASTGSIGSEGDNFHSCFFNDGGFLMGQTYFNNNTYGETYLEFRKMHITDTSSNCLGMDTLFGLKLSYNIKEVPTYLDFDPPVLNQVIVSHYKLVTDFSIGNTYIKPCRQENFCDTLKIHGPDNFCSITQPQIFTAFKNPECGSIVQWDIDTSAVSNMSVLNDTSVSIQFKNINWQGKIHASLPAGHCTLNVPDSMMLHVTEIPEAIKLGPDTVLCNGQSIELHAGPGYASYLWQDGSADSILTLSQSGEYFVTASDFCGNSYHDTIIVSPAHFLFSLGTDTVKCNSDTLVLKATTGFINYQWLPNNYNIQDDPVSGIAHVYPAVDTNYMVSAEKWPGCYVYDTIHVTVFHSPVISLGNDTSLCYGQSLMLNAGPGFANYLWNTGESSPQINISHPGQFTIRAGSSNGCFSTDTMNLIKVYSLPAFSLSSAGDTTVCDNKKLFYGYSFPNATYNWSDGNNTAQESIQSPGIYWLAVTQNGCVYRDTVNVIFQQAPQIELGNDTTLCEGVTKMLDVTTQNASYLWQDGTSLPTYSVGSAGTYFVSVNINSCVSSDTIQISYLSKPSFAFDSAMFICQGAELRLEPAINVPVTYEWQDGSTSSYYTVREPGIYSLSVSNSCGTSESSINIITGQCKLWMPNAFSPNNDGKNDVFRVKWVYPVKEFKLQVFSRWGQLIFQTNNMNNGWNGTLNGEEMPEGSYVWMINMTDNNNIKESYNGTVILIR